MLNTATGLVRQYNRATRKRIARLVKQANASLALEMWDDMLLAENMIHRIVRKDHRRQSRHLHSH